MSVDVVVALIANAERPFETMALESEWARPYDERPKAELTVDEGQTLAEVLEAAAEQLDLRPPAEHYNPTFVGTYNKVAFYKPEDEHGFADRHVPRYLLSELTLIDDRGQAIFGVHNLRGVRYSDLLRAAEGGVLNGDPLRPYLVIEVGYGDAPPPDWGLVFEGLKVLRETLQVAGEVGGVLALGKLVIDAVRERLGRGQEALESNPEWMLRGYSPYQFTALILSRDWSPAELAQVLGCSEQEAKGVLWVLGFADDEAGRWQLDGDEAAKIVRELQIELAIAAHDRGADWPLALERRASRYLETGRPEEGRAPEVDDEQFELPGPTAGERVGDAVDLVLEAGRRLRSRRRG